MANFSFKKIYKTYQVECGLDSESYKSLGGKKYFIYTLDKETKKPLQIKNRPAWVSYESYWPLLKIKESLSSSLIDSYDTEEDILSYFKDKI
jgi:hypothetical protein